MKLFCLINVVTSVTSAVTIYLSEDRTLSVTLGDEHSCGLNEHHTKTSRFETSCLDVVSVRHKSCMCDENFVRSDISKKCVAKANCPVHLCPENETIQSGVIFDRSCGGHLTIKFGPVCACDPHSIRVNKYGRCITKRVTDRECDHSDESSDCSCDPNLARVDANGICIFPDNCATLPICGTNEVFFDGIHLEKACAAGINVRSGPGMCYNKELPA